MGFAAVLFCEAPDLDAVDDAELVSSLVALVGADSYPVRPLEPQRCGPWLLAGSFHSNQTVRLSLDTAGDSAAFSADVPTAVDAHAEPVVSATISSAQMAAATREYMRSPERMATAVAERDGSVDPHEVLFGPDPLEGRPVAGSLWWFHLDAADLLAEVAAEDLAALAAQIREASRARSEASVTVAQYATALCCAGRVAVDASVRCEWSGNRLLLEA